MRLFCILICGVVLFGCSVKKDKVIPLDSEIVIPEHLTEPRATPTPFIESPTPSPTPKLAPKPTPQPSTLSTKEADELIQTREDLWRELIGE
jgi:hypothetical protein